MRNPLEAFMPPFDPERRRVLENAAKAAAGIILMGLGFSDIESVKNKRKGMTPPAQGSQGEIGQDQLRVLVDIGAIAAGSGLLAGTMNDDSQERPLSSPAVQE